MRIGHTDNPTTARILGSAAMILGAMALAVSPAPADDDEVLAGGSGVEPNIMILMDSSGSMDDEIDGTPKIDIAKTVITDLINNTSGVRFGVMKFKSNGGEMVGEIGTDKATLTAAVNAVSASGNTPLGDQLYDAGRYYKGTLGSFTSPIQFGCQLNFAIVMSDGMENNSNRALPDEATLRYTEDHSTSHSGTQNVVVHTVGFAIADDEEMAANSYLMQAASNGGGTFYSTDNAAQLEAALQDAISQIIEAAYSFSTPAIPSTSSTGSTRTYIASFDAKTSKAFWPGYLKAYQRGADGQVPVDGNGTPLDSAIVWDAGQLLSSKAASARDIYTVVAGSRVDFETTTASITPGMLGASTVSEKNDIIQYVRGVDTYDEDNDSNTSEERAWKLGDIYHSTPVLVTPPPLASGDPSYVSFRTAQASRTQIVLAGANDGMLHAFRESDGQELWGFVPPDQLPRLKNLTVVSGSHDYYVDATPIVADVKISGAWKTVAILALRRGGTSYHALDITDTTNPLYLWSFTDGKMAETWSEPAIGRIVMDDSSVKHVAFVGGGYDTPNNNASGKAFFVIDIATGTKLWEYSNDGTTDDRQYMNFSIASAPTAVDLDADGLIERVYVGDIGGQMWKFDVSAAAHLTGGLVDNWTGKRLFAADPTQTNPPPAGDYNPAQALYEPPALSFSSAGDLWVYFGTGDRNHPKATSSNRFYGVKDNTSMANGAVLTEASLVDVTTTNATAAQGWYFRLSSDEKVLAAPDVFFDMVFFTTYTPASTVTCTSGIGDARLYAVQTLTGYAAMNWATGVPRDPTDASQPRSATTGTGIPSDPEITVHVDGNGDVTATAVVGTTGLDLDPNPAPTPVLKRILYWKEIY